MSPLGLGGQHLRVFDLADLFIYTYSTRSLARRRRHVNIPARLAQTMTYCWRL